MVSRRKFLGGSGAALTSGGRKLSDATWGKRNTTEVGHALARFVPVFKERLMAPAEQLPGDSHMPRVSAPDFGQSERLVVVPGKEEEALFNLPGGQSGHPLSPYYRAGFMDWVQGNPSPFLPGASEHRLTLQSE